MFTKGREMHLKPTMDNGPLPVYVRATALPAASAGWSRRAKELYLTNVHVDSPAPRPLQFVTCNGHGPDFGSLSSQSKARGYFGFVCLPSHLFKNTWGGGGVVLCRKRPKKFMSTSDYTSR